MVQGQGQEASSWPSFIRNVLPKMYGHANDRNRLHKCLGVCIKNNLYRIIQPLSGKCVCSESWLVMVNNFFFGVSPLEEEDFSIEHIASALQFS